LQLALRYRHLPRRRTADAAVLDVGCGNGQFLYDARRLGWKVLGLDPDATALVHAQQHGLDVILGDITRLAEHHACFDVITLSHVIEHVHDPVALLLACHDLLRPGGRLWLETPNLASMGHARFGQDWRGLEPPRHLVLFDPRSLPWVLQRCGFNQPTTQLRHSPMFSTYAESARIARTRDATQVLPPSAVQRAILHDRLWSWLRPARREFLTVTARRR
jgi:SAM-dependent methyltransferase